jgi:hypothetical protein
MIYEDSKRIVVVKGIHSNFVEEAILILKHQPGNEPSSSKAGTSMPKKDGAKVNTEYLLKEAETIINSYIVENKLNDKYKNKQPRKKTGLYNKKLINIALNTGIVLSIGLLIFILSKFL